MNAKSEAMTTVRRFVDRVRRRSRIEDGVAGAVVFICGACGAAVGWPLGVLALAPGCAVAFLGARLLARALLRPPPRSRVAAWIESATPELRDTLATAVEAGNLAEASAEYAAPRIADARPGALLPARVRRQRAALVASAVTALVVISVVASLARPGTGAEDGSGTSVPVAPEVSEAIGEGDAKDPRGVTTVEVVPAVDTESRMTLRAVAVPRERKSDAGPVDATEILVSSPQGFERAVELFVTHEKVEGDDRRDD
jgi:hypothetical protein